MNGNKNFGLDEKNHFMDADDDDDDREEEKVSIELDDTTSDGTSIGSCLQTAVIQLPSFVDDLTVDQMSPEIEKSLALHLDLAAVGSSLKNWEYLAYFLGMDPKEIKYLQERAKHPVSPTVEVLYQFRNVNLGSLLRIIRDKLHRLDVIVAILPHLTSLKQTVSHREDPHTGMSNSDSGFNVESASSQNSVVNKDLIKLKVSQMLNDFDRAAVPASSNQPHCSYASPPVPLVISGTVLVTYYPDNEQHQKYVKWFCKNLKHFGAKVIRDDSLLLDGSGNMTETVHSAFQTASQVVCILSDRYRQSVEQQDGSDQRAVIVRYIYKLMESDYLRTGCTNYRFRPILFPFCDVNSSLPMGFLQNTILWHWPAQQSQLFRLLFNADDQADRFSLADESLYSF